MELETMEAMLAKERVRNSSRAAVAHGPEIASIGMQGALVYALLDISNSIRSAGPSAEVKRMLSISDAIVDAIADGASAEILQKLAVAFKIEREGFSVDQLSGLQQIGKLI